MEKYRQTLTNLHTKWIANQNTQINHLSKGWSGLKVGGKLYITKMEALLDTL